MIINLEKGDCIEIMKKIKSESVDLIICDLPYGMTKNKLDVRISFESLWAEYERIIKDNGAIILFGQGKFYIDLVNSNIKLFRYDLVWNKVLTSGFLNSKRQPLRKHEQIAIFYKRQPVFNPQFTEGQPLHGKGTGYKYKENINNNYGEFRVLEDTRKGSIQKYPTSILEFPKPHPSVSLHPTAKPVELIEYLIKTYSNENDTILDNCMGSGTTGVASVKNNRNFIGIEKSSKYFDIAKRRINKELERGEKSEIFN